MGNPPAVLDSLDSVAVILAEGRHYGFFAFRGFSGALFMDPGTLGNASNYFMPSSAPRKRQALRQPWLVLDKQAVRHAGGRVGGQRPRSRHARVRGVLMTVVVYVVLVVFVLVSMQASRQAARQASRHSSRQAGGQRPRSCPCSCPCRARDYGYAYGIGYGRAYVHARIYAVHLGAGLHTELKGQSALHLIRPSGAV